MSALPLSPVSHDVLEYVEDRRRSHAEFRARYLGLSVEARLQVLQIETQQQRSGGKSVFYTDPATGRNVSWTPTASVLLMDRAGAVEEALQTMTQKDVASLCGVTDGAINRVLARARALPETLPEPVADWSDDPAQRAAEVSEQHFCEALGDDRPVRRFHGPQPSRPWAIGVAGMAPLSR